MWNYVPNIVYDGELCCDIVRSFNLKEFTKKALLVYYDYEIQVFETAEKIAYDYYGSVQDVYLIYLANDIIDPQNDWLMKDKDLREYCIEKYGLDNLNRIHHYELNGVEYRTPVQGATAITNWQYEEAKNEAKRKIKLIRKEYLTRLREIYKNLQQG